MGQKNQIREKLTEAIFENPEKSFTIREFASITKIPKSTIQRYVIALQKEHVMDKENKFIITNYTKFKKASHLIDKLFASGIIDYLEAKLLPSVIIVFGSVRKGEYNKDSDIDIFIETTKGNIIDISKFEKKLKHKIQLFKESDINNLPKELFNNIVNGIKLSGYLRIK